MFKRKGVVKGLLNNVKKNCTFLKGGLLCVLGLTSVLQYPKIYINVIEVGWVPTFSSAGGWMEINK